MAPTIITKAGTITQAMLAVHHKMMISTILESSSPSRFVDESDRVVLSDSVGDGLERGIGEEEGAVEGIHVGCSAGTSDDGIGEEEGAVEGIHVGCSVVGTILGEEEGSVEGNRVGCSVGTSDVKTHVHVVTQPTLLVGYRVGYHVGYRVGTVPHASAKPYAPNPTATGPSSNVAAIVVRTDGRLRPDDAARQVWPYSELVCH